jgi:uncharacterized protein YjiK
MYRLLSCLLLFAQCHSTPQQTNLPKIPLQEALIKERGPEAEYQPKAVAQRRYRFDKPDAQHALPKRLKEVSGLAYLSPTELLAINDEEGKVYALDAQTGKILREYPFGEDDDYEDLAYVDGQVYVLSAEGSIHRFALSEVNPKVEVLSTPLDVPNDCEGLCYLPERNALLIAAKESASITEQVQHQRGIFLFDLQQGSLDEKPYILLSRGIFQQLTQTWEGQDERMEKFLKKLRKEKKSKKNQEQEASLPFQPSALAIHPITREIYVLSAVQYPMLAVLSPQGQVQALYPLPLDLFEQPEGLSFAPNGDLWICSEGKDKPAQLLFYRYN